MFSAYADDKLFYSPRLLNEGYAITEPQATLELNKAGSFTFNLPSINPMYSSLKKLKTIITIREDDEVLWKGRVLNDAKDFYNTKAVTCEGELAFLNDIQYEPHDYSKKGIKMGEYFKKLIEHYASECSEERMIKLGNVRGAFTDVLIYPKTTDYTNVWNLISGNLIGASTGKVGKNEVDLSDYDRYLYIRREKGVSYIDFVEDIGKASSQIIEFGKNLLDLSEYVDASNVYTQIIPLGKADSKGNRVDIKLVNGGKNYLQSDSAIALFGKIQKSVIWEDVTNRNTLKANGQRMLNKAVEMAIKITIRAFDLHRINVNTDKIDFGDKVHVVSLPHEISSDFLCSKIVFTLDNLENTEYTFGLDFETMSGSFASYKRTYQYKMESALELGTQNAQDLLDAMTRMDSLQTQVDGSICSWFYPGVPTAENYPAVEWATPEAKHAHIGDLYYDKSTGIGYRWTENSEGYYWDVIEDKQVQQALTNASRAQSTADGKVRCFSTQPYPPYEVGDLWVQGDSGDILCCQHDRESGSSYVASDWVRASKYTDDTKAIEAGKTATDYIKDGAGGIQVGPNGSSNVTMTDEGLVFNGIRNLVPLWENADPTSGMASGTVICSDGRLASYAAIAIGCQEYYTSPFDSASTDGGLIQYTIVVLNGKEARCSYVWDKSRARKVTASKNGITFGPGGYYETKKLDKWIWPWTDVTYGAKFDAHNQCCVPVVIYGFL
jgi:hypothetical protein|nr:MAG TPA: Putative tail protein [Caudoviricetes sp.]